MLAEPFRHPLLRPGEALPGATTLFASAPIRLGTGRRTARSFAAWSATAGWKVLHDNYDENLTVLVLLPWGDCRLRRIRVLMSSRNDQALNEIVALQEGIASAQGFSSGLCCCSNTRELVRAHAP